MRITPVILALALAGVAACHNREGPQPRRGMDILRCPPDSQRVVRVMNRGRGPSDLVVARYDKRNETQNLTLLGPGETREFELRNELIVLQRPDPMDMRRDTGQAMAVIAPRGVLEVEYFCR